MALFSGTTQVSQYQKGKTNLDFNEARDSEWQWHQLGHMQVCTSLQTDKHASTPPLSFFTSRMPFLSPNQQRQSTEGINIKYQISHYKLPIPVTIAVYSNRYPHFRTVSNELSSGETICPPPIAADLHPCAYGSAVRTALVAWPWRCAPCWPWHYTPSWPR